MSIVTASGIGRDVIRDNVAVTEQPTVELHIVSDSTGETAARLVLALEAQFPEQAFEEVRHTRAETVDDLERAVASARGHAAVLIYTLVDPELRDAMRRLCRRARVHYCDLLGHPIDAVARVSGHTARMPPGNTAAMNPEPLVLTSFGSRIGSPAMKGDRAIDPVS